MAFHRQEPVAGFVQQAVLKAVFRQRLQDQFGYQAFPCVRFQLQLQLNLSAKTLILDHDIAFQIFHLFFQAHHFFGKIQGIAQDITQRQRDGINLRRILLQCHAADDLKGIVHEMRIDLRLKCPQLSISLFQFRLILLSDQFLVPGNHVVKAILQDADLVFSALQGTARVFV